MTDPHLKDCFARDVVLLKLVGLNPVVVHGGGPQIENLLTRMGKKGEFIQGMRVTDAETMEVVEMVLGGQVNKEIVNLINKHGGKAVGLTGKDAGFIRAKKLLMQKQRAGRPDRRRPGGRDHRHRSQPDLLPRPGRLHPGDRADRRRRAKARPTTSTPTWSPASSPRSFTPRSWCCSPTPRGAGQGGQPAHRPDPRQIDDLIADGTMSGGMLPKIGSALDAARNGVKSSASSTAAWNCLLLEILTDHGVGTMIKSK